ncbi:unnamed protein product [Arabis nemorensis]|uniref:Uncharacterized protein n=1 Tax=Arabis nemorensis TaxID=586526 RepID=A0A565C661_9BRAS|nr:unnamed protein product [Arabis nemorensis]
MIKNKDRDLEYTNSRAWRPLKHKKKLEKEKKIKAPNASKKRSLELSEEVKQSLYFLFGSDNDEVCFHCKNDADEFNTVNFTVTFLHKISSSV